MINGKQRYQQQEGNTGAGGSSGTSTISDEARAKLRAAEDEELARMEAEEKAQKAAAEEKARAEAEKENAKAEAQKAADAAKAAREKVERAVLEANELERTAQEKARAAAEGAVAGATVAARAALAASPKVMTMAPRDVNVTLAHGVVVSIPKGNSMVEEIVAKHWFAERMGVVVVDLKAAAREAQERARVAIAAAEAAKQEAEKAKTLAKK